MTPPKLPVKKEFLLISVLLTVIYAALETYYNCFISDQFAYMGFEPDLNLFKYAVTKAAFIFLLVLSHGIYKKSRFLFSIHSILLFLFYFPVAILFSCSDLAVGPFAATTFFVSSFALAPYFKFPIPSLSIPDKFKPATLLLLSVSILVPLVATFGSQINLKTLLLSEISETREAFSLHLRGALAYLYNIGVKTIIPASLIFFLIRKKYFFAAALMGLLLYLYLISGNKLVYFTPLIVVFFYFVGKDRVSKLSNFFLVMLILLAAFPVLDNFIIRSETPLLSGTFVNRLLFIPALLTNFYFDFFDGIPFYFAESNFFNRFVENPYGQEVGFMMSEEYWAGSGAYMNNGIVSDGFMNLGYTGVVLFSIAFSALFGLFHSLRLHKGYFGLFFAYLFLMLSVPFLSSLVTGGIALFVVLSILVLKESSTHPPHPIRSV